MINVGFDVVSDSTSDASVTLRSSLLAAGNSKHLQQCKLCQEKRLDPEKSYQGSLLPGVPFAEAEAPSSQEVQGPFKINYSIAGMSCTACVNTIGDAVKVLPGVSEVVVSLLDNSASAVVEKEGTAQIIAETIEDCGFEATIMKIKPVKSAAIANTTRTVSLLVKGMHSQ